MIIYKVRLTLWRRHMAPRLNSRYKPILEINKMAEIKINDQPTPISWIKGSTSVVATAPNKHRNTLFVAVIVADRSGNKSTSNVCTALNITCDVNPTIYTYKKFG